jgi:hypothetical protein
MGSSPEFKKITGSKMFSDYKTEFDTWARGLKFSKLDRILTEINRYLQKK